MRANPYQLPLPFERRWPIETLRQCVVDYKGAGFSRNNIADYLHRIVRMVDGEEFYIEFSDVTQKFVFYSTLDTTDGQRFNMIEVAPC